MKRFWAPLGLPGAPLGAHVDPMARHGAARGFTFEAFLATSVQRPVFHHFWVAKRYQKCGFLGGAAVMKTLQIMYGSQIVPFLTRSAYKTTFGGSRGSILAPFGRLCDHFCTPWPAPGATCAPFLLIGAHLYFQVRFSSNLGSQGDAKSSVSGMRAALCGVMGKQHLAPLGRVPA